jgi:DNA-binding response OmpR family regulator
MRLGVERPTIGPARPALTSSSLAALRDKGVPRPVTTQPKRKLGELLVEQKLLTSAQLEQALAAQGVSLLPLGSTLIKQGTVSEQDIARALSSQLGVPAVDLGASTIATDVLAVMPLEVAAAHRVLPMAVTGGAVLNVAIANPLDQTLLDEISFASGRATLPFVVPRCALEEAIRNAYAAKARGETFWRGPRSPSAGVHLEVIQPPPPMPPPLPAAPSEIQESSLNTFPAPPTPRPRAAGDKPRVLAVDDEADILDIIDKALSHRGLEVIRAMRGREALDALRTSQPDLVLLDAMLPEIHGFEICRQIKQSAQYQHVPVVIISAIYTGWNFIQDVKRIYGADDYIAKPFKVMELVHRVEDMLQKAKGRPKSPDMAQATKKAAVELRHAAEAFKAGQIEATLEAAQRAVNADPFDARAHFLNATAFERAGRFYEAISAYERVVELAPGQFNALKNLAALFERQGFKAKAAEMWLRALEQSPSEPVRQTIKAHLLGLL